MKKATVCNEETVIDLNGQVITVPAGTIIYIFEESVPTVNNFSTVMVDDLKQVGDLSS